MNTRYAWRIWLVLMPVAFLCVGCPPEGDFVVSVQRISATDEEAALITIAEQVCPVREDVLGEADAAERDVLDAEAGDDCLWWYGGGELRDPYAITADTVDYFTDRVNELQQAWSPWSLSLSNAHLYYEATIEYRDTFTEGSKQYEDVYLVVMTMHYSEGVAPLAGTGFEKERQVLLSADGEVLAVFGDGPTLWWIA